MIGVDVMLDSCARSQSMASAIRHGLRRGAARFRGSIFGLLFVALGFAYPFHFSVAESESPNVIVIFVDDIGYGELGFQGNDQIPTPNIDSIAAGGVRFTNGYVTASYCSPSRASLLSGRYQRRLGYETNPVGSRNEEPGIGFPPAETTLAEALRDAGYATALVGKWHLGARPRYHPLRHGFDFFFGFHHEGHYYAPSPYEGMVTWLRRRVLPDGSREGRWRNGNLILSAHMGHNEPDYDANNPIYRNGQPVTEKEYLTDAFTREAVDFIERNRERPFFLYLAYNAIHSPMQAPPASVKEFQQIEDVHRRIFAAMLSHLDEGVGKILDTLKGHGLKENTLLFFLSDNGGATRELTSSNSPLRGGKGSLYEGGVRIPFLVQWPAALPAGEVYDKPVSSLDVFPTAINAADGSDSIDAPMDGVDLIPYLTGNKEPAHRILFWKMGNRKALRQGHWKIVDSRSTPADQWELYDLAEDMGERNDLARKFPKRVAELSAKWERLSRRLSDDQAVSSVVAP